MKGYNVTKKGKRRKRKKMKKKRKENAADELQVEREVDQKRTKAGRARKGVRKITERRRKTNPEIKRPRR